MARALLLLAGLALAGAAVWWFAPDVAGWFAADAPPPAAPAANGATAGNAAAEPAAGSGAAALPAAATQGAGAGTGDAGAPHRQPAGLADRITSWLLVQDENARPVDGAAVRRFHGGDDLSFTDARGLAGLPLAKPEQLSVHAEGHLLRLAPTQIGTTEELPQRVTLVRDTLSF